MAERIWTGATDTSWSTAGNWSPATVPVNGDSVIFQGTPTNNLTTSLAATGVALNRLTVMPSFTGYIGGSGPGHLEVDVNSGTNPRLIVGGTSASKVYINGSVSSAMVESDSTDISLDGGTITILCVNKGTITLRSGLTPTTMYVGYYSSVPSDVAMTIESSVTLGNIFQFGGAITCASSFTNLYISAGTFAQSAGANSSNLYLFGGTFTPYAGGGWTHSNIYNMGGTFNGEATYSASTITNTSVFSPGASVVLDKAARTTLTNAVRLFSSTATLQAVGSTVVA